MTFRNHTWCWVGIALLVLVVFRPNYTHAQTAAPIDNCTGGFQFHRLEPLTLVAEQGGEITAYGCEFVEDMNIRVAGIGLIPTSFVSPFVLTASVPGGAAIGQYDVQIVKNNDAITFPAKLNLIAPPPAALPKLAVYSVEPLNIVAQDGGEITVIGDGFNDATVVRLSGIGVLATTVLNRTTLLATVASGLPQNQYDLQVVRGADVVTFGKKLSLTAPWQPMLQVNSLEPSALIAADGGTLTILGNGFDDATAVRILGVGVMETTVVNSTLLRVTVPSGLPLGQYAVQVVRGADVLDVAGGVTLTSAALSGLRIDRFEPLNIVAQNGGTVSVYGSGFTESSAVRLVGQGLLPTTFISANLLSAEIPPDLQPNQYALEVVRGSEIASNGVMLNLTLPTTAVEWFKAERFEPSSIHRASGGTLTIYGQGFSGNLVVRLVGYGALATEVRNRHTLVATVPTGLPAGQYDVLVIGDHAESPVIGQLAISFPAFSGRVAPVNNVPPPQLVITNTIVSPAEVRPGERFTISFELLNAGQKAAHNVLATLQSSRIVAPVGGSGTQLVPKIGAKGRSGAVVFELVVLDSAESGQQSITTLLDFADDRGNSFSSAQVIGVTISDSESSTSNTHMIHKDSYSILLTSYPEARGVVGKRAESADSGSITKPIESGWSLPISTIPEAIKLIGDSIEAESEVKPEAQSERSEAIVVENVTTQDSTADQTIVLSADTQEKSTASVPTPSITQAASITLGIVVGLLLSPYLYRKKSD